MSQASSLRNEGSPRQRDAVDALDTTMPTTAEVAMLAVTALGFAITAGTTDDHVRRLTDLADDAPDVLVQACTVTRHPGVPSPEDRTIAVELLGRAAQRCAESGLACVGVLEDGAAA